MTKLYKLENKVPVEVPAELTHEWYNWMSEPSHVLVAPDAKVGKLVIRTRFTGRLIEGSVSHLFQTIVKHEASSLASCSYRDAVIREYDTWADAEVGHDAEVHYRQTLEDMDPSPLPSSTGGDAGDDEDYLPDEREIAKVEAEINCGCAGPKEDDTPCPSIASRIAPELRWRVSIAEDELGRLKWPPDVYYQIDRGPSVEVCNVQGQDGDEVIRNARLIQAAPYLRQLVDDMAPIVQYVAYSDPGEASTTAREALRGVASVRALIEGPDEVKPTNPVTPIAWKRFAEDGPPPKDGGSCLLANDRVVILRECGRVSDGQTEFTHWAHITKPTDQD